MTLSADTRRERYRQSVGHRLKRQDQAKHSSRSKSFDQFFEAMAKKQPCFTLPRVLGLVPLTRPQFLTLEKRGVIPEPARRGGGQRLYSHSQTMFLYFAVVTFRRNLSPNTAKAFSQAKMKTFLADHWHDHFDTWLRMACGPAPMLGKYARELAEHAYLWREKYRGMSDVELRVALHDQIHRYGQESKAVA